MCFRYAHLYPELQFQLSRAINSHQVSIAAIKEKTAFALKRTNPEQMGWSAPLTKAQGLSSDDRDSHSSRGFLVSTGLAPNFQLFTIKSLSSFLAWLYFEKKKKTIWAEEEMRLYFQRQRIAKIERHFNEFLQWGATCFIQIIGWLATLKWPALDVLFSPLFLDRCKAPLMEQL